MQDQKKMLIDSMRKLISHVSSNKEHQIEIYRSLTKGDLAKILTNLEDPNPTLRKMSARLVCELLYKNGPLKEQFGELMGIRPVNGHIVINKIPQALIKRPDRLLEAMHLLKTGGQTLQIANKNLYWFIDPLQSQLTINLINNSNEQLVDPKDYLLGISVAPDANPSKFVHQSVVLELRANLKEHRPRTSITSTDTDRYSRGIRDVKVKKDDRVNITQEQFRVQPRISTRRHQDRVRTDQSQYLRLKGSKGSNIISNSPQSSAVRGIDKTLRQKKNQKHGITIVQPGHLSDRAQRDLQFHSKTKANSFVGQIKNSFLAAKDVGSSVKQSSRPRVQVSSHRQSFDSNYKPSQIFLKKFRDSQRKLY